MSKWNVGDRVNPKYYAGYGTVSMVLKSPFKSGSNVITCRVHLDDDPLLLSSPLPVVPTSGEWRFYDDPLFTDEELEEIVDA